MWGAGICGEGWEIGYTDGGNGWRRCHPADEMVTCSGGNSAGLSGRRCVPPRPTDIPWGVSAFDRNFPGPDTVIPLRIKRDENGQIVRNEDGNIDTVERGERAGWACDGHTWLEHLSQWVCDGREHAPTSYVEPEPEPERVCTNYGSPFGRWVQVNGHYQWQIRRVCTSQELARPSAPKPLGGPAPSGTVIHHTSNHKWPTCTESQLRARDAGAMVACE